MAWSGLDVTYVADATSKVTLFEVLPLGSIVNSHFVKTTIALLKS